MSLPVLVGEHSYGSVTDRVLDASRGAPGRRWWTLLGVSITLTLLLAVAVSVLWVRGVGVWGIDIPVAWGFAIINFVWWIGIGHAGTLISAILFLARQPWRTSINRIAEAMTLFAVLCAALFPLLHLGRLERFYWILPYPDTMDLWPQWRSPLVWDFFAVFTYATVSLLFWYQGLVPDLASLRDAARPTWVRRVAGVLSFGWRGSVRHWQHYQVVYLLLAALATPLVVSVHSIVSLDFAAAIVPGWHSTIFPPYFVAGAIYSGFAMVLTIIIPLRAAFGLHDLITARHLDAMGKLMLAAGLIVAYGYAQESFFGWYSADEFDVAMVRDRLVGAWAVPFWATLVCNVFAPQALWSPWVRRTPLALFVLAQFVNVGMWLERYVIVVTSLQHDHLPSAWGLFVPTLWDWATFLGTIGLFSLLIALFVRFVPMLSMFELRELLHGRADAAPGDGAPSTTTQLEPACPTERLHGVLAEFDSPERLVEAARRARAGGWPRLEAYTPFPVKGLDDALGLPRSGLPAVVLGGGLLGAGSVYFMQWYSAVVDYPWNVGGRPLHSWPAFFPPTFEALVLGAALAGVVGLFAACRLPRLYHPVFGVAGFARATRDRFMLCLERTAAPFDREEARRFLASQGPLRVCEVPE